MTLETDKTRKKERQDTRQKLKSNRPKQQDSRQDKGKWIDKRTYCTIRNKGRERIGVSEKGGGGEGAYKWGIE